MISSNTLRQFSSIGSICLVVLVFQNTLFFYATHEGRTPDADGNVYFAPTMVLYVQLLKAIISFGILLFQQYSNHSRRSASYTLLSQDAEKGSWLNLEEEESLISSPLAHTLHSIKSLIFRRSALKLAIPATLYVIQTNLAVLGAQNLDSTSFVIASQLKFATTALCTSIMLKKVIGTKRWLSLGALSIGVFLVQLQGQDSSQSHLDSSKNPIFGLLAIITACFISGFAAIYLEKILKDGDSDLWAFNIQLACFGMIPAILPVLNDAITNGLSHPFQHFGFWAWTTVEANVMGGLVVALIMKYADNIQKSMAISVSIIVTFLITVVQGKAELKGLAIIGSAVVIGSIIAYNRSAPSVTISPLNSPFLDDEKALVQQDKKTYLH